jgi:hypothetical protein
MSDDADKKDDKVVETIKPLTPTQFLKITCSTCGHPILCQSNEAFQAAREDHLNAVHRPQRLLPLGRKVLTLGPDMEVVSVDDPDEEKA